MSRYRVAPEAPGTVRKWVVRIPSSKIILVPSGPLETEWFQATYEGVRINGSLYDGDAWDGSPIQAEVFPGTYTLSGYIDWRYAYGGGDKAEPPDEMTARVQFDPPVVEASEGQEITAVVSIVVYKAWLPVDVGGGTIRRVWALSPGGIRIAPELARYWPEDLVEVDQGKASRVRGWHLTSDGQLFVAPDEAGTREEIAVGPFAVVELEDGNYVVVDAKDRDPALGGTILPDSTTYDDPGIDIQVAYAGESPPASVELYLTFTRMHRSESAKPHALTFRRQLKVPMGQSRIRVPRGFTCWITDVGAKSGSSWKRVVSPAEEKESIFDWTSYGGGLTNGDSLTISLQD